MLTLLASYALPEIHAHSKTGVIVYDGDLKLYEKDDVTQTLVLSTTITASDVVKVAISKNGLHYAFSDGTTIYCGSQTAPHADQFDVTDDGVLWTYASTVLTDAGSGSTYDVPANHFLFCEDQPYICGEQGVITIDGILYNDPAQFYCPGLFFGTTYIQRGSERLYVNAENPVYCGRHVIYTANQATWAIGTKQLDTLASLPAYVTADEPEHDTSGFFADHLWTHFDFSRYYQPRSNCSVILSNATISGKSVVTTQTAKSGFTTEPFIPQDGEDFTVEMWFNLNFSADGTYGCTLIGCFADSTYVSTAGNALVDWSIWYGNAADNRALAFRYSTPDASTYADNITLHLPDLVPTTLTNHRLAIVRKDGIIRFYLDDTLSAITLDYAGAFHQSFDSYLRCDWYSKGSTGSRWNLRIHTKALESAEFLASDTDVPSNPVMSSTLFQKVALQHQWPKDSYENESQRLAERGEVYIQTPYYNREGNSLTADNRWRYNHSSFGATDFTIETMINVGSSASATSNILQVIGNWYTTLGTTSTYNRWRITIDLSDNKLQWWQENDVGQYVTEKGEALPRNTDLFICVERYKNIVSVYVNGKFYSSVLCALPIRSPYYSYAVSGYYGSMEYSSNYSGQGSTHGGTRSSKTRIMDYAVYRGNVVRNTAFPPLPLNPVFCINGDYDKASRRFLQDTGTQYVRLGVQKSTYSSRLQFRLTFNELTSSVTLFGQNSPAYTVTKAGAKLTVSDLGSYTFADTNEHEIELCYTRKASVLLVDGVVVATGSVLGDVYTYSPSNFYITKSTAFTLKDLCFYDKDPGEPYSHPFTDPVIYDVVHTAPVFQFDGRDGRVVDAVTLNPIVLSGNAVVQYGNLYCANSTTDGWTCEIQELDTTKDFCVSMFYVPYSGNGNAHTVFALYEDDTLVLLVRVYANYWYLDLYYSDGTSYTSTVANSYNSGEGCSIQLQKQDNTYIFEIQGFTRNGFTSTKPLVGNPNRITSISSGVTTNTQSYLVSNICLRYTTNDILPMRDYFLETSLFPRVASTVPQNNALADVCVTEQPFDLVTGLPLPLARTTTTQDFTLDMNTNSITLGNLKIEMSSKIFIYLDGNRHAIANTGAKRITLERQTYNLWVYLDGLRTLVLRWVTPLSITNIPKIPLTFFTTAAYKGVIPDTIPVYRYAPLFTGPFRQNSSLSGSTTSAGAWPLNYRELLDGTKVRVSYLADTTMLYTEFDHQETRKLTHLMQIGTSRLAIDPTSSPVTLPSTVSGATYVDFVEPVGQYTATTSDDKIGVFDLQIACLLYSDANSVTIITITAIYAQNQNLVLEYVAGTTSPFSSEHKELEHMTELCINSNIFRLNDATLTEGLMTWAFSGTLPPSFYLYL